MVDCRLCSRGKSRFWCYCYNLKIKLKRLIHSPSLNPHQNQPRKADVLNRGFAGYNSELLKRALPRLINGELCKEIACLTLCVGANDSWSPIDRPKYNPSLPLERYTANVVQMVEFLLSNGLSKEKILLITPPTIVPDLWAEFCKKNVPFVIEKTPEHTRKYADAMIDVGKQFDIKTFDMFELTSREEHLSKAFVDGLHFSDYGAKLLCDLIRADVERLVEQHRGTNRQNFPTHQDVNYNEPETFYTAEPSPIQP